MPEKNESFLLQQSVVHLATVRNCSLDQSALIPNGWNDRIRSRKSIRAKERLTNKSTSYTQRDLIGRYGVGFQFMNFNEGKRISTNATFYFDAFNHQSHMNGDAKCLERFNRTFYYTSKTKQSL